MCNGLVAFNRQYKGQQHQQGTDTRLCVRTPVGSAFGNDAQLVFDGQDQRADSYDQHKGHGEQEHLVVLARIAQPGSNRQQTNTGQQLVGSAEQTPDLGKAVEA